PRHDHSYQKTTAPRTPRLGKRVQRRPQQNPLENRTNDREPEDLENPPYRLPPTTRNLYRHHQRRHRTTVLPDRLNKPHCVTERQAHEVLAAIGNRMEQVGLRLHPTKTKIVYCKDGRRTGNYEHASFTFLGFTFRPRAARRKDGARFLSFTPAISTEALKKLSSEVRSWRLHQRITHTFTELANAINAIVA